MNTDRSPLLRDTLNEAATPAWSDAALAWTLAAARAQRRRRVAGRWAGVGVLLLMIGWGLWPREVAKERQPEFAAARLLVISDDNAAAFLPKPTPPPKPVHFLTDEELLARFPDRSVALIGSGAKQQLVFLDGATEVPPRRSKN